MGKLTRGELAKRCGVNRETIRYYERVGLLPEPSRTASGYCLFQDTAIERIHFIKQAQSVGFSLEKLKMLLEPQTDMPLDAIIRSQIAEIDTKVEALYTMRTFLVSLL